MSNRSAQIDKLAWYANRLKTMSLPEINYRLNTAARKKYERWQKVGYFPKVSPAAAYPSPILFMPELAAPFETEKYNIFGRPLRIDQPIDWHQDIITGGSFPLDYSYAIDTRTEKHGIVKVTWEVNRLQFLTHICLQYRYSGERKYLQRFIDIITSWKEANPYLKGVNWYSNIEVNLRIITWFLCWEILEAPQLCQRDPAFKKFTDGLWLPLIYLHGQHADKHPSKFSSSNNHLIAEASGLFIAGAYWDFPKSKKWVRKAQNILEREIQLQHSPNGINREEASEYIQFITDFFLIAYIVGERSGFPFSDAYRQMLKKIFHYIYHLMGQSGRVPYYGDDDDGHTFVLSHGEPGNNFRSLLASGAILFNDPVLKSKAGPPGLKNKILFGPEGMAAFDRIPHQEASPQTCLYQEEGHLLIKNGRGARETYLHVDTAPLGYLSIAAHGHADALSFFLEIDGQPYITDVGTYTYHSEPEWRAYFKGTLAHNTIRVDEQDQASNAGPCLWVDHYQPKLVFINEDAEKVTVRGSHDGYAPLGVTHTRTYQFNKEDDTIVITDHIESDGQHVYEIPFHLHPEIRVEQEPGNQFTLSHPQGRAVRLQLDESLQPRLIKGAEDPILGWYSPSFLQKEPTTTIYSRVEKAGSFQLTTIIEPQNR
ncbi:MAG: alginate lyase family protein [Lewinellaceae bacterium]|nr:alginate lyase family protein [Phaeodactylibacter sp.]MCB9350381.1 alginate lyase family protein [Lewinellaceae bacterium]